MLHNNTSHFRVRPNHSFLANENMDKELNLEWDIQQLIEVLKQVQRRGGPSVDKCEAHGIRRCSLVNENIPRLIITHLHTSASLEAKQARQTDRVNTGVVRYNKLDSNPSNPVTGTGLASEPQSCPSCHATVTVRLRDRLVSRVARVWLHKSTTQRPPDALYLGNSRGLGIRGDAGRWIGKRVHRGQGGDREPFL